MAIRLYNSLTRTIAPFEPLTPGEVRMYVCGPTVYDEPHLGHLRSAYLFDVIRRYFAFRQYGVVFVRNVTDVDDKIIEKARQELGAGASPAALRAKCDEVAERYLARYQAALARLGVEPPTHEPRATHHVVPDMTDLIAQLLMAGVAYEAGGDVYVAVRQLPAYGKLANRTVDELRAGARVEPEAQKRDPLDFALWKAAKPGEPAWTSPWGPGRPGWHIECTAMSTTLLGDAFDIHGGGQDLIFPHHENEIAQAEAAGKPFARVWLHNGLVTVEGQKMSKSLGNVMTLDQALERADVNALKILFLSSHYRHAANFTWDQLEAANQSLVRFDSLCALLRRAGAPSPPPPASMSEECLPPEVERHWQRCETAMDDDINTPQALSALYALAAEGVTLLDRATGQEFHRLATGMRVVLRHVEHLFGLRFLTAPNEDAAIQDQVRARETARKRGDFATADQIRQELLSRGIVLEDTAGGTVWRHHR